MISLNSRNNLPDKLKLYYLTKLVLIILLISIPIGIAIKSIIGVLLFLLFFVCFPLFIIEVISYNNIFFSIDETKIIINYGIISKKSNAIAFDRVQNITCTKGPLLNIFGLSKIEIWTASPGQVVIQKGSSSSAPEEVLILLDSDSKWLQDFILNKHNQPAPTPETAVIQNDSMKIVQAEK